MPRFILVVSDHDILLNLKSNNIRSALVMGSTLHYLIRQYDMILARHKQDLIDKKPGALPERDITRIIWVCMIKRLAVDSEAQKEAQNLQGKFYSILEEHLADHNNDSHRIIRIEVRPDEFDFTGYLTNYGKQQFWKEINWRLKKFDMDKITLCPRASHQMQRGTGTSSRKLPIPQSSTANKY